MVNTPNQLNAGDSLDWVVSFPDFPASDGWGLIYVLTNATNSYTTEFVVSPQEDAFAVSLSVEDSVNIAVGDYTLFAVVNKEKQRKTAAQTRFSVLPNVTSLHDRRTQAERTLQAIEDMLEGKAEDDQQMIQYAGRTLSRYTFEQLEQIRSRLKRTVLRERARKAGAKPFIGARFR